jgi:hypothetical protein
VVAPMVAPRLRISIQSWPVFSQRGPDFRRTSAEPLSPSWNACRPGEARSVER